MKDGAELRLCRGQRLRVSDHAPNPTQGSPRFAERPHQGEAGRLSAASTCRDLRGRTPLASHCLKFGAECSPPLAAAGGVQGSARLQPKERRLSGASPASLSSPPLGARPCPPATGEMYRRAGQPAGPCGWQLPVHRLGCRGRGIFSAARGFKREVAMALSWQV